jgi:hypothetical protein
MNRWQQYLSYRGLRWYDYLAVALILPFLILFSLLLIISTWRADKPCG